MNFQTLTVQKFEFSKFNGFFRIVKLEHHLDHFTLGLVFHKRPLADKTLIQLAFLLQKKGKTLTNIKTIKSNMKMYHKSPRKN